MPRSTGKSDAEGHQQQANERDALTERGSYRETLLQRDALINRVIGDALTESMYR